MWPYGQEPIRLLCPQESLGKNTGVGFHFLLHIWPTNFQYLKKKKYKILLYPLITFVNWGGAHFFFFFFGALPLWWTAIFKSECHLLFLQNVYHCVCFGLSMTSLFLSVLQLLFGSQVKERKFTLGTCESISYSLGWWENMKAQSLAGIVD